MSANCSFPPAKPNCKFHKKNHPLQRTSRAHSANSKSMLSSLSMSTATIKEIDFEVSHSWDNDEEDDGWDTEEGSGGRLPHKKRSLPAVAAAATVAARPKARHRSVGTTMAPAEELLVVGKGGRVRRTKVRRVSRGPPLGVGLLRLD